MLGFAASNFITLNPCYFTLAVKSHLHITVSYNSPNVFEIHLPGNLTRAAINVRKSPVVDLKLAKRLVEESFQDIRKSLTSIFKEPERNRDDSVPVETMENHATENSKIDAELKMNLQEGNNNAQAWIAGESGSRIKETSVKYRTISSSKFIHQRPEIFRNNEETMGNVFKDPNDEEYTFDFGNEGNTDNKELPSSYKFGAHLEIARDDEDSKEPLANSEMKIEKCPEMSVSRSLAVKFLASILKDNGTYWTNSKEFLCERTFKIDAFANVTRPREKHVTEVKREEESYSKMSEKFEEYLLFNKEDDTEIRPWKENDYPGEQSAVVPENQTNSTEEKSVMHLCMNVTKPRNTETEKEEEFGPYPGTNSLKNSHETESTISLDRPQEDTRHGKEEEDLNAIIRRMIITELKKQRKKEQTVVKRAHSDTESVISRKRHNIQNRTGLFSLRGRTFFQDLVELEESLRKNVESTTDSESTVASKIDEAVVKREDFAKQDGNRSESDVKDDVTGNDRTRDSINSTSGTVHKIGSNIQLERKVNARCLTNAVVEGSIVTRKVSTIHEQSQVNKSTQTEHAYVIHSVRSCPLRKRHLPLQAHRLPLGREAVCSKTVYASTNLSRFVFRKASDNLIYEKSKGSQSPSYISAPERFRWKYVTPKETK
ncbi:hypothetical protein ANTRET_LOCUS6295 [Anthophora retusa]